MKKYLKSNGEDFEEWNDRMQLSSD
jgi:peptide-methionine (S)-S-oxide reductase